MRLKKINIALLFISVAQVFKQAGLKAVLSLKPRFLTG
jgi:hypothetical protein